jgi:hypothetical protein
VRCGEPAQYAVRKNAIVANLPNGAKGLRATIHINDVIFPDYLYQLVDYYPGDGGAHRRFSQRYGIIGRSWRSKTSHGTGAEPVAVRAVTADAASLCSVPCAWNICLRFPRRAPLNYSLERFARGMQWLFQQTARRLPAQPHDAVSRSQAG